jgi:hypothetical protein
VREWYTRETPSGWIVYNEHDAPVAGHLSEDVARLLCKAPKLEAEHKCERFVCVGGFDYECAVCGAPAIERPVDR